ncbi:MAG: AtpZ/AtpI family protein [Chloroflexi bacterium]|nr:AtpZ/AtpI family protein [Chloroflexota bacterium]MDA8188286.1 AtpZ/AtpI family protein [Dehalococcoidales bacterium]
MNRDLGPWALLLQLGWTIALSLVGSLLVGIWLDQTLHTSPLGVLFFSLLGIIIGSVAVYRQVVQAINAAAEEQPPRHDRKVEPEDKDDSHTKED